MSFTGELFGFQVEAFKRMLERRRLLLAYEMGLGKTVIVIATLEHLLDEGKVASGLIITPSSLKYQWARMIEEFTEDATVIVIDGPPAKREQQFSEAMMGEHDYIILNYEQCVNDWDFVKSLPRDYVVVDECTAIKSFTAKRSRRIKRLQTKYLFGLSGQPVENRPEEVFSIMQWIDAGVLGRFDTFDRTFIVRNNFGRPMRYKNLPTLHRCLAQSMVRKRRTDPDVADQLPKVTEELVSVDFDAAGAKLYRLVSNELLAEMNSFFEQFGVTGFDLLRHYGVAGGDNSAEMMARGRIMSKLTALRMLCDNPALLKESADKGSSQYAVELKDRGVLTKLPSSPKTKECLAFITEILEADPANKVVVFSFFKGNLRLLEAALPCGSVQFTGEMNAKQKDAAKQKFKTDPACRVFLSSDAGGYGVDLPEGRYLINFDLPWSAGKLDQRNARIIRLSSTWESVTLLTMIMRGSIEERMYDLLRSKQATAAAVVDGRGIDKKGNLELDLKSLTEFLQLSSV